MSFKEYLKEKLNEMAKPREKEINKVYYHGTPVKESADNILQNGIQPNKVSFLIDIESGVKGYVYITPSLLEALYYAGSTYRDEKFGYIFEISGKDLKDIYVDDDYLKQIIRDVAENPNKFNSEKLKNIKIKIEKFLKQNKINKDELRYIVFDNKELQKLFNDENIYNIIDYFKGKLSLAHKGKLEPTKSWEIEKKIAKKMFDNNKEQDFFKVAKRIK